MTTEIVDQSESAGRQRRASCLARGCLAAPIVVLVLMLVFHLLRGSPVVYTPPIRGQAIDGRTGKPLGGVVIVARWYTSGVLGTTYLAYASEGITKADGSFVHPGMPLQFRGLFERFTFEDPELYLYKPGYSTSRLNNDALRRSGYAGGRVSMSPKRPCYWDGKTIPLYPVGSIKAEAESLESFYSDVIRAPELLHPRRFPLAWAAVIDGSHRVPRSYLSRKSSPEESYEYHMRNEQ